MFCGNFRSQPNPTGQPPGLPQRPAYTQNKRLQQTQAQVDEVGSSYFFPTWMVNSPLFLIFMLVFLKVVDIMRVNVDKVLERDQKLSELDDRAGILCALL